MTCPVLYTLYTRARLTRCSNTVSAISRCSSTLSVERPVRGLRTSSYCVLGMSHICISLYKSLLYRIALGRDDPLGVYTCETCRPLDVSLVESLLSLSMPLSLRVFMSLYIDRLSMSVITCSMLLQDGIVPFTTMTANAYRSAIKVTIARMHA
jgi:hypothetical protein